MRAVMVDVPQQWIDERRAQGGDRWDEVWEGELHMAPPPGFQHNDIGSLLVEAIRPIGRKAGLKTVYETGVWATGEVPESYRVPDVSVVHPHRISERGIESTAGTLLAIEIRSPDDEAYLKLPFYGRVGVTELLVIDIPAGLMRRYTGDGTIMTEVTDLAGVSAVALDTVPGVTVRLTDRDPGIEVDVS